MSEEISLNVDDIKTWRSIITLVVFVLTNLVVLFPFHVPMFLPKSLVQGILSLLQRLRVIPSHGLSSKKHLRDSGDSRDSGDGADVEANSSGKANAFTRFNFPMNFMTAPLIADCFLLAILAIGREEVYGGTVGSNNIAPLDIMAFFLTLAYIAISIDASGLIRYLAFKVLQWGGEVGHRLFFYLYAFFFLIGSFIGNDPIILSGTAFLAYMTRVSSNIEHPRAWIHTQFAVANIASAILVSSNPTNLVLAGAFQIKFIDYTANMIVPVVITAILLFPCLLYIIFAHERLIPISITMHDLPEEIRTRKPVNPNIPNARGIEQEEEEEHTNDEEGRLLSLEEIMNPFLDKAGATFGAVIMAATLITVLALNAASTGTEERPVFYVTLPAAVVMFCWDVGFGWTQREETRKIARQGRKEIENARAERLLRRQQESPAGAGPEEPSTAGNNNSEPMLLPENQSQDGDSHIEDKDIELTVIPRHLNHNIETQGAPDQDLSTEMQDVPGMTHDREVKGPQQDVDVEAAGRKKCEFTAFSQTIGPKTLVSRSREAYRWCQETFPTVIAVLAHLPFALVPFALSMFVLVEALVTKGWVPVFAYGWDHWVNKTGTVGAIGGMGFLSVILCNVSGIPYVLNGVVPPSLTHRQFAGTNIGTTILLSRVVQAWQEIHHNSGVPISDRTFWATVYSMALGVNYGAFSTAFSGSLAGLLWRDILARKHINVRRLEFARVNLPIIAISMTVGCTVLIGEVYIMRSDTKPYSLG
ncbi:Arsenical pump membrane protein [Cytospora mali]|uniref:Arsenical pump membrane protein n=1 Tax=Cytospora mali TaxID=578113 RepID=A0A194UVK0_CYTMA|nr:Arsenical pump membrane protein [Valsa mali var. pyri (nom. inval.)]